MYCADCGTNIGNAKFCPNCGWCSATGQSRQPLPVPAPAPESQSTPVVVNMAEMKKKFSETWKKYRVTVGVFVGIVIVLFLVFNFTGRPEGTYVYRGDTDERIEYRLLGGFFKKNSGELEIYIDGERQLDEQEDSEWSIEDGIVTLEIDGNREHFYYTGKELISLEEKKSTPNWDGNFEHGDAATFDCEIERWSSIWTFRKDGTYSVKGESGNVFENGKYYRAGNVIRCCNAKYEPYGGGYDSEFYISGDKVIRPTYVYERS